jgi:hypothetical protein
LGEKEMIGLLFIFIPMILLSAYVTSIDKYNGKVENTVNAVVWIIIVLTLLFKVYLGGI